MNKFKLIRENPNLLTERTVYVMPEGKSEWLFARVTGVKAVEVHLWVQADLDGRSEWLRCGDSSLVHEGCCVQLPRVPCGCMVMFQADYVDGEIAEGTLVVWS